VTRRPALRGTVPHWKVLSRNTQAFNAGRICPTFQKYFKLLIINQINYSKEKVFFEVRKITKNALQIASDYPIKSFDDMKKSNVNQFSKIRKIHKI
jgi:hypothetical protein